LSSATTERHWFRFVQLKLLLHLCRFVNQEELMEREVVYLSPADK